MITVNLTITERQLEVILESLLYDILNTSNSWDLESQFEKGQVYCLLQDIYEAT